MPRVVVLGILALELLCVYVLGRRLLDGLVSRAARSGPARRWATWVALAPGVALHEASHALTATAVLGRVVRFVPFAPRPLPDGGVLLGEVQWRPSRIPVLGGAIGRALVGLAPLVLVPAAVYVVGCVLVRGVALGDAPVDLVRALVAHGPSVGGVLWLLLALSASVGLLPSPVDHRDLPRALVLLTLVGVAWVAWRGGVDAGDGTRLLTDAGEPLAFLAQLLAPPAAVALVGGGLLRG